MSRGPEQRFWTRVRDLWTEMGGHAVRIEASIGGCDPGTPDTNLSIDGRGGWVELKVWPQPLEPTQLPWHMHATRHGAYCAVLCQVSSTHAWVGLAEAYEALEKRPKGHHLQEVLKGIRCALTRPI